jgi:hypothetical protein
MFLSGHYQPMDKTDVMFALKFDRSLLSVTKIRADDFTAAHHDTLARMQYQPDRLIFPDARWRSRFMGRGEEKAVFCVCDHEQRVFALELINERQYLNGRFVGGEYFFSLRAPALVGVRAQADSEFGLTFTGLVKVREYAHGFEWSRFQFDPFRPTLIDPFLTAYLRSIFGGQFREYQARYKDVHDRNVLFEIRPFHQSGVPLLIRNEAGRLALVRVVIQPIDVR